MDREGRAHVRNRSALHYYNSFLAWALSYSHSLKNASQTVKNYFFALERNVAISF